MKRIVLIACASKKLTCRARAKDLYTSPLFKLNMAYAKKLNPNKIYIISAKYGLLDPELFIEPYDVTLNRMPSKRLRQWADKVLTDLKKEIDLCKDEVIFLAGDRYRKYLTPVIRNSKIPLQGLPIGKQLRFLKASTQRMDKQQDIIVEILVQKGTAFLNRPHQEISFSLHSDADKLLNNLEIYPHAFVLACIMDRQIKAERAWAIPYEISKETGGFEFHKLQKLEAEEIKNIFNRKKLHRFNDLMSKNFYLAVQKIHRDYGGVASRIWAGKPRSASVVRKFLEFQGVGIKIATMSANILARDFKIPMTDHLCIDISPDVHVMRVFRRLGLIPTDAKGDTLIYSGRELNPEFPGIFDLSCWEIGRNWCKPTNPICNNCYLNEYCPKKI